MKNGSNVIICKYRQPVRVDIILKIKRHIGAQLPRAHNVSHSCIYLHIFRMYLDTFMNDDRCELISDYKIWIHIL